MARFTIRVQLRNADIDDYKNLNEKMKMKGFFKRISSSDGKKYRLPEAEYIYDNDKTRSEVLDIAYDIAKSINAEPAVLVTHSAGRVWKGLDEI